MNKETIRNYTCIVPFLRKSELNEVMIPVLRALDAEPQQVVVQDLGRAVEHVANVRHVHELRGHSHELRSLAGKEQH